MNIEAYIASGILEAYVLGELTEQERAEVETALENHPQLKKELEQIELGLEKMAMQSAIKPPSSIKNNLYERLEFSETNIPSQSNDTKIIIWKRLTAVAAVFFLVAVSLAINFYSQWQTTQSELQTYIAQNELQANEINKANLKFDSVKTTLDVALNPDFRKILLAGTDNAPDAKGLIYWNANTSEVFLKQISMMDLPEDKVYQLWAIVDGKPQDAGLFTGGTSEFLKMKNIETASAFAVTIEPAGGSINPTLETMQIIGEVPA